MSHTTEQEARLQEPRRERTILTLAWVGFVLLLLGGSEFMAAQGGVAPPTILHVDPPHETLYVPVDTDLVITFSEPVRAVASKRIVLVPVFGETRIEILATSDAVTIADAVVTVDPMHDLDADTIYIVVIDEGAFENLAGTAAFPGLPVEDWIFTTTDGSPPTVSSFFPLDGAQGVATGTDFVMTFDRPVTPVSGKSIFLYRGVVPVAQFAVDGSEVAVDGDVVTIEPDPNTPLCDSPPTTELCPATGYSVAVEPGAFVDASGEEFEGIVPPETWDFTTTAEGPAWGLLNGGHPVGARFGAESPYVSVVALPGGGVLYSTRADNLGRFMGRLDDDTTWEIWTDSGWSSNPAAQPISIQHPHNDWFRMSLYNHPDAVGGLLGLANQRPRISSSVLNHHGIPTHFLFDPTQPGPNGTPLFRTWDGGRTYDDYLSTALYRSWAGIGGGGTGADFAFDPVHREGMVVSRFGNGKGGQQGSIRNITAVRFRLDGPDQSFTHWKRDDPGPTGPWPPGIWSEDGQAGSPHAWILDNNADPPDRFRFGSTPRLAHVPGTRDYFVAYGLDDTDTPEYDWKLGAALYSASAGSNGEWFWWDGVDWQPAYGQPTTYLHGIRNLLPTAGGTRKAPSSTLVSLTTGRVLVLSSQQSTLVAQHHLYAVLFDAASTPQISSPTPLGPHHGSSIVADVDPAIVADVDPAGDVWLAYVDRRGAGDAYRIHLRKRDGATGAWTLPQLIWEEEAEVWPEAIAFFDGSRPMIFLNRRTDAGWELVALGRDLAGWPVETPLSLTAVPDRRNLQPSSGLQIQKTVEADLGAGCAYGYCGTGSSAALAADADGYLYMPMHKIDRMQVHPPTTTGPDDVRVWGGSWSNDHLMFPGGVAVYDDPMTGVPKIFAVNRLTRPSSSHPALTTGEIQVWQMSSDWLFTVPPTQDPRDHDIAYHSAPDHAVREYSPQIVSPAPSAPLHQGLAWSQGLAVDAVSGRLYATSAATQELIVYDIVNTADIQPTAPEARFRYAPELLRRVKPGNEPHVNAIVYGENGAQGLVTAGYLEDKGSGFLAWIGTNWPAVRDFVLGHPSFGSLSSQDDDTDLMRNLQKTYKDKRDRPQLLARIPLPRGSDPGEFAFPTGVAVDGDGYLYVVDTENHRIQKLAVDPTGTSVTTVLTFGSIGRGPAELLYPVGISVSENDEVFVTDPENDRVVVFDTLGNFQYEFSRFEDQDNNEVDLRTPLGIYAGRPGYLYLAHDDANRSGDEYVTTFTRN